MAATADLPDFDDVRAAVGRIDGIAVRTPLLEHPLLNAEMGGRLLLKAECLQPTGSFKFRGALNRLRRLDPAATPGGVVAYSSGNHAQAVAAAARLLGLKAAIVMPADAPAVKRAATEAWGGEVIAYDRFTRDRARIAADLARARGAVLVPPYEDRDIIAGQGTAGLEIVRQLGERGLKADAIAVCCGGGGLTAGIALAAGASSPATEVFAVEPERFDDTARSLAIGKRVANDPDARGVCDALLAPEPGEMTFAINRTRLAGGLVVSENEVGRAMRLAFERFRLVVEPGGAVALAAALSGRLAVRDRVVAVVLSGGNVDPALFLRLTGLNAA